MKISSWKLSRKKSSSYLFLFIFMGGKRQFEFYESSETLTCQTLLTYRYITITIIIIGYKQTQLQTNQKQFNY